MADIETCPECGNEMDSRGLCPQCDSEGARPFRQRPRIRDEGNGAPDMSNVVVRFPTIVNRPVINLPEDFPLAPDPIEEKEEDYTAPTLRPAPVDRAEMDEHERPQPPVTATAPIGKEIKEEAPTMGMAPQPPITRPGGALARLKTLAQETRQNRAARIALSTELPAIVVILEDELFPEHAQGDAATRKRLDQEMSEVSRENPKADPFIRMYRALLQGDARLRADYNTVVSLARTMDEAYQARDQGKTLTSEQSDILREADLEKMSAEALTAYQVRITEAAKVANIQKEQQFQAVREERQKNRQELAAMATHTSILDALDALADGEKPMIAVHLGTNLKVPGQPSSDGRFHLETLRGPAVVAIELSPSGTPDDENHDYRATVLAESELVCFKTHIDSKIGQPGVFAFTPDFPSLAEKWKDPFEVLRYTCRRWIFAEKTRRSESELLRGYREGTMPTLPAKKFFVDGEAGPFYASTAFTMMGTNQPETHLECVLQRDEKGGAVKLAAYASTSTHQDAPRLDALKNMPLSVTAIVEPVVRDRKPVLNQDLTPRMRVRVSCEPFGFRKALLDTPNEQKARLANLLNSQMGLSGVETKTLRERLETMNHDAIVKVARIAIERKVVPQDKVERVQGMLKVMPLCAIMGTALFSTIRDQIQPDDAKPVETAETSVKAIPTDNGLVISGAEATQVAEATQSASTTGQENPVAAA